MTSNNTEFWNLHIRPGDKQKLRELITSSNKSVGIKTQCSHKKLTRILKTGEGSLRIINIVNKYFQEKVKAKN